MNVIFKEGLLYLQGVKFGKKTWRKTWTVLYKPSSTGVGRLEFHPVLGNHGVSGQKKAGRQKTADRKVVRLSDLLSVGPAPDESCPQRCTAFFLNTIQCTYTLASTSSQDWLSALGLLAFQKDPEEPHKEGLERGNGLTMENNDIYSSWKTDQTIPPNWYKVTVQNTEASRRCRLAGDYLLSPEQEAVALYHHDTGHIIFSWPYTLLRKFGQIEGGFNIEAGRRCESGEGVFAFRSPHGPEIFHVVMEQCSRKTGPYTQPPRRSSDPTCGAAPPTPAAPPLYSLADVPAPPEDASADLYATVHLHPGLSSVNKYCVSIRELVGDEDEDETCSSLGSLSLDDDMDIYCNVKISTPPMGRDPERADPECIYSDLREADPSPNPGPHPPSSPLFQPVPQPYLCSLLQPALYPKPRYQPAAPASLFSQANAPPHDREMEGATGSSALITPSEAPGSFKQRLAEILSKDLAKVQPPPSSRVGGPAFSQ